MSTIGIIPQIILLSVLQKKIKS